MLDASYMMAEFGCLQKGETMDTINLALDQHPIRFTPDGKVAVMDAIRALSDLTDSGRIWHSLSQTHPEIISLCDTYHFIHTEPTPVADSEVWDTIQGLLFDYLVAESLSEAEQV